jgi:hypothetical protein
MEGVHENAVRSESLTVLRTSLGKLVAERRSYAISRRPFASAAERLLRRNGQAVGSSKDHQMMKPVTPASGST